MGKGSSKGKTGGCWHAGSVPARVVLRVAGAAVAAGLLAAAGCAGGGGSSLLEGAGAPPAQAGSGGSPGGDLGLERTVEEFILSLWGGDTPFAESDHVFDHEAKLDSADPEVRRRGEFELDLFLVLFSARSDDPHYARLYKSMVADAWSCAEKAGLPPLERFALLSEDEQEALYVELGLVGERMRGLVLKCWEQARIRRSKSPETAELLDKQQQYYMKVAKEWVQANPDKVVPLPE